MKLYAIRDRLIDYFMQPFVGPDDKNVCAAVARTINQGEITSDIAQAPHHFEVWSLAQITEDGHIVADRYLIQDCAALVRAGLRETRIPASTNAEGPNQPRQNESRGPGVPTGAPNGSIPGTPPRGAQQAAPAPPAAG